MIIFFGLFLKQCNDIKSLHLQVAAKEQQIKVDEFNRQASIDTIKQSYDAKTGELTATIKGYQLTTQQLTDQYSTLFGSIQDLKSAWKNAKPSTIVNNQYSVNEKISDVTTTATGLDSMGSANISFIADTIFSPGNTRKISGKIPFSIAFYKKQDSSLLNYSSQSFYSKVYSGSTILNFDQEMNVFTGLNKDPKTGQVSVWAKTNYPGVHFNVLKGASIEDDKVTTEALKQPAKRWGIGFSLGVGGIYNTQDKLYIPSLYFGIGLNYTPKKLQF